MNSINLEDILSKTQIQLWKQLADSSRLTEQELEYDLVNSRIIESGIGLIKLNNISSQKINFSLNFPKEVLIFAFPLSGDVELNSEIQNTQSILNVSQYGILVYPFDNWSFNLSIPSKSNLGLLCLSVKKVHELFNLDIEEKINPEIINANYRSKNLLISRGVNPVISIIRNQLFSPQVNAEYSRVYEKAKVLELLIMYMEQSNSISSEKTNCPVVHDNLEEEKIRRVEKILIHNMTNPPSIPELAKIVGTNELKLKNGFKRIFGNTIYGYLMDYRMDSARLMLSDSNIQIKDVAYNIGYTNTSHFIAAFKKKFGITPKKYLQES